MKYLFAFYYIPCLVISTIVCGLSCLVFSFFSKNAALYASNILWSKAVLGPAFIKLETLGLENLPKEDGFIIYANHRSLTDIPAVSLAIGRYVTWVAKKDLAKIPFFGWGLARVHMLVDRDGGLSAIRNMVQDARKRLSEGEILSIFPEGTRNTGPNLLLPFKRGTFILAKESKATILPVAIFNSDKVWPAKSFLPNFGGIITVKIGKPLEQFEDENLKEFTKRAEEALSELLQSEF